MPKTTIGLIGFPTLLDHMISRILEDYNAKIVKFDADHAGAVLSTLDAAFFFWPDSGDQGVHKMKALKKTENLGHCPLILVANPTGVLDAQRYVGRDVDALIQTPLQTKEIAEVIAKHAKTIESKQRNVINIEYVNSLLQKTLESLEQLTGLKCERTKLEYSTEAVVSGYVTGTVGFTGSADGYMTASFPKRLAAKIASATMSTRTDTATDIEISTSVSELMDTIANTAKDSVASLKDCLYISSPQVFAGGPHIVTQHRGIPIVVLQFKAEDELFSLLIYLRQHAA